MSAAAGVAAGPVGIRWGSAGFAAGVAILAVAVVVAVSGSSLVPHDPLVQELAARNMLPDAAHWLGRDHLGRDIAARLVAGTRISLLVALGATLLSVVLGAGWGWWPRRAAAGPRWRCSAPSTWCVPCRRSCWR